MELQGRPTGRDVIAALDSATSGPTYKAGVLRAAAIERLKELEDKHGTRSIGFEMLGPPRLTKLLYEGHILSQIKGSVQQLADSEAEDLARTAAQLVEQDDELRITMVSVGIPILLPRGRVYRAERARGVARLG
jgi:hypothetical protein